MAKKINSGFAAFLAKKKAGAKVSSKKAVAKKPVSKVSISKSKPVSKGFNAKKYNSERAKVFHLPKDY